MTPAQRHLLDALAGVTFVPGTAAKRIVHEAASREEMSDRMERCLWRIAYQMRRQLPREIAEEAVRRKVDHQWIPRGFDGLKCSICGVFTCGTRGLNSPCLGPPEPRPEKVPRKRKVEQPAPAVVTVADERQEEMF